MEHVAAIALAAQLAGQAFGQFPFNAALGGTGVARGLQHGSVEMRTAGKGHGVEWAAQAYQLVFEGNSRILEEIPR